MKTAAIVTIREPQRMSKKGRSSIAKWLRKQAYYLEKYGATLAPKFQARYIYK